MSRRLDQIRMRDPFILDDPSGGYVLFGTTDENLWDGPATGFDCYTSEDLDTWVGPFPAFRPTEGFWADTQFWAPEVHVHDGRYFMFATFASSAPADGPRGVQVLVADEPTGPFVPWSDGPLTPRDVPCLDGTLFIDDEGAPWLVYSRGAEGVPGGPPGPADGEMYALPLSADLKTVVGSPLLLFTASSAPWSKPLSFPEGVEPPEQLNLAKDPLFTDGPFFVRSEGGVLHLLWSSFGEEGYAMGVATSETGLVTGPWTQRDEPLWARNGGHGMVFTDLAGVDRLVFHWPNNTPDERVRLSAVDVSDDGIRLLD
ncbi:glycoside hydrolase [Nocardioides sp. Root1257]|uniref:glycoside hydrolase family 43 protein n=1 Tax=unclassified Nocardioides TaxID=2615069 RepID=UPI0006F8151B|nr:MULTISPECIES: glycoside hydrolase family 43 protein [unclassified Nocardioides]KQW52591.1 glycoside hydrolase [Nocardioides sp. Root1257]KRC54654.1 glycoside hydrolase [Nocardioides sp. Root224]